MGVCKREVRSYKPIREQDYNRIMRIEEKAASGTSSKVFDLNIGAAI